jgi:hypothetical protein
LIVSDEPDTDSIRKSFKAIDGRFYSFIDYDLEFKDWLKNQLLRDLTKDNLLNVMFDEITFWKESSGWTSESKTSFMERNYELIKSRLSELNSTDCQYNIFTEGLNPYIFESDHYKDYFNNCGESKDWIYPVKNVAFTHTSDNDISQDHFEFLRTDNGYRLLSITIRKGKLK